MEKRDDVCAAVLAIAPCIEDSMPEIDVAMALQAATDTEIMWEMTLEILSKLSARAVAEEETESWQSHLQHSRACSRAACASRVGTGSRDETPSEINRLP